MGANFGVQDLLVGAIVVTEGNLVTHPEAMVAGLSAMPLDEVPARFRPAIEGAEFGESMIAFVLSRFPMIQRMPARRAGRLQGEFFFVSWDDAECLKSRYCFTPEELEWLWLLAQAINCSTMPLRRRVISSWEV